ncbi:hypothetical protein ACJ41O_000242 [Fusarium nematophilum]
MAHTWTVLYPSEAEFDYEYYTTKHMALFEEAAGSALLDWRVAKIKGDNAPFQVLATFVFSSAEAYVAVMVSSWGEKLYADIKSFSNMSPVAMEHTEVVAREDVPAS